MGDESAKIGEINVFDPETGELEQFVTDGINIHITGSEINKIDNITIYLKEVM